MGIDYKNGKTIFKCTESVTKIIHTNFEKEIKMVIDDYKYLIKMLLNNLNKINNETKFE
jgi:DNA-binding transcriptional regulator GbsR (MarR family)